MRTTSKKMGGFMCQSPAATAVCMSADPRSAVVPRKPVRESGGHGRFTSNGVKYSKLIGVEISERRKALSVANSLEKEPSDVVDVGKDPMGRERGGSLVCLGDDVFQVVVMRVALHCQGCASKIKRHLTRMEGVTSFSIDLEAKKVTVMGHISPVGVLESISKVKRAELWTRN